MTFTNHLLIIIERNGVQQNHIKEVTNTNIIFPDPGDANTRVSVVGKKENIKRAQMMIGDVADEV